MADKSDLEKLRKKLKTEKGVDKISRKRFSDLATGKEFLLRKGMRLNNPEIKKINKKLDIEFEVWQQTQNNMRDLKERIIVMEHLIE